ncbi:MAG TPA: glycoside hydrolase family 2 TIM barrel-domain containing protein [Gaiellaceae bacterium]|nr:glycoside hydrolase family 2 TIM barrel-domain containing protein [Gaiellaceae bacterium]
MTVSLDGIWDFFPGDHALEELERLEPVPIRVPGLWEAQGHLDLDGAAWYRRRFDAGDAGGWRTLRFGAVMDRADVYVNGVHAGSHESAFTPFELDVTHLLCPGENVVAVRVEDPPAGSAEHLRSAHGKQGWANHSFPSRPSMYLTYGGIWQPVTLLRHGPVVVRDVFVDGDPDALTATLAAENRTDEERRATIRLAVLGCEREEDVRLAPRERRELRFELGATDAPRWSPAQPVLHEAVAEAVGSDRQVVRFGLRTVRVEGRGILLGGEPWRMKAALVQGFRADELYAEGDDAAIGEEIRAAQAMGFDTLRLHLKAFDPRYLDACDELGMLVHADLPVAEPVAYEEVDAGTTLARRCAAAAREQVRRDRNHPSIVLWTAMNEIGERLQETRRSPGYAAFACALHDAVRAEDPTRPIVENDWVEPDPAHVHRSPIVTAHWYGRLHRDWLDKLERKLRACAHLERPFLVSEFGDWGLPEMPEAEDRPFWDFREVWAAALARALWPGTVDEFVAATQRYQGLSDRLQGEVLRRHDHVGGYCVTELTDVPHELNGLLDVHRRPKAPAAAEVARLNAPVLPMLDLRTLAVPAGEAVRVPVHVANDGPALADVELEVGEERLAVPALPAHRASALGEVTLRAAAAGRHEVALRLRAGGRLVGANAYPLFAVPPAALDAGVCVLGGGPTAGALSAVGARPGAAGPLVVAEGALDAAAAAAAGERLARGETVLVLAQPAEASLRYPASMRLKMVETRWGQGFLFTTDGTLSALPPRAVLAGEDATLHARDLVTVVDGEPLPERPLVVRYNARGTTGTIVGAHPVGRGTLLFCQFGLARRVLGGDAAARALLADLVRLACVREPAAPRTSGR